MLIRLSGLLSLVLLLLLNSCDFNKKDRCIQLDNKIGMTNDSLLRYGAAWGSELDIAISTLDFTGLSPIRVEMEEYIDRKVIEIKELKNVGGSETLLKTELDFLKVEKSIVSDELTAFEQFNASSQMDDIVKAYADMQVSAAKERELLQKIHKLRDQFAEKNDFPKYIEKY